MNEPWEDRRRHRRVFFSEADQVRAAVSPVDAPSKSVPLLVMDLSEGGLFLAKRRDEIHLAVGQRLFLTEFEGLAGLSLASGVEMEVKWVFDSGLVRRIGCGCEFLDLPANVQDEIRRHITIRLRSAEHTTTTPSPAEP